MGPRRRSRGNGVVNPVRFLIAGLQWGRGVEAAEMQRSRPARRISRSLQWGRGVEAAEIRVPFPGLSDMPRFNGAAA